MTRGPAGVVIVGASAAGLSAADGLREGGYEGTITILDEELDPSYERPMLSKGLLASTMAGGPTRLRTAEQLRDGRLEVRAGHGAVGLDVDRRLVVTDHGEALPWDQLVVATGASARPMATAEGYPLPTLRTLADHDRIQSLVARGEPVAIIGSGFIGLEVAAALRTREIPVTVLSMEPPLLPLVGAAVSEWVGELHRGHGVELDVSAQVTSVTEPEGGYAVHLADGRAHSTAVLLVGIGAAPRAGWLTGSGLDLDNGVRTDQAGRTNVGGVWAVGDVANSFVPAAGRHRRSEHWTHAVNHGRHVGLNIARGEAAPYDDVSYVWTEQYGRTLHLLGERRRDDVDIVVEGEIASGEFVVVHGSDDELHAVTICGRVQSVRTYKKLMRVGASLPEAVAVGTPA